MVEIDINLNYAPSGPTIPLHKIHGSIHVIFVTTRGSQVATWVNKSQIELKSNSFLNEASVKSHDRNKNVPLFNLFVKVDTAE